MYACISSERVWRTHRAVVILWADITAFLAPVDLKITTAADLTHILTGGLVHTCLKITHHWDGKQFLSFSIASHSKHSHK